MCNFCVCAMYRTVCGQFDNTCILSVFAQTKIALRIHCKFSHFLLLSLPLPPPHFSVLLPQPHTSNSNFYGHMTIATATISHSCLFASAFVQWPYNHFVCLVLCRCLGGGKNIRYNRIWGIDIGHSLYVFAIYACRAAATVGVKKTLTSKFPQKCYKHVHFKLNGRTFPPNE